MIETSEQVAVGSALADVSTFPVAARGAIFLQALRDNLPGILAWGAGYSALLGVVTALYPILQENNTLLGVVRGLGLLGIGDSIINLQTVTSYAGYLALQATSWGPLILSVYLIPQTLNVVAREEERGTLDILLSTPLPRWRFLVEKTLAVVASLLGILLIMWLALVLSINLVAVDDFTVANATAGIWHMIPISLTIIAATLLLSVSTRSARSAGGLAALFVLASYFVRAINDLIDGVPLLDWLNGFSIFSYYRSLTVLVNGVQWAYDALLLAVAAALFALALWQFQRRDLGV